jgi:hypothetical protein
MLVKNKRYYYFRIKNAAPKMLVTGHLGKLRFHLAAKHRPQKNTASFTILNNVSFVKIGYKNFYVRGLSQFLLLPQLQRYLKN